MKKLLITTAIIASLAGNAALAEGGGKWREERKAQVEQSLSKLPKDKAELVRGLLKDMRPGKEGHEEMKANFDKVNNLLTADKFDRNAYLAANKAIDEAMAKRHQEHAAKIADVAAKLTVEERKVLAEVMPRPGKHGPRHGGPDGKGPGGKGPEGEPEPKDE